MFTLLQLSDIHRSESDPISNDELLSCLITDSARFQNGTPSVSMPNAIIVSGDLVQGLPLGSMDYPHGLQKQYDQALEFLTRLADVFVDGDHSKVIIIPGNHDVDWNKALKSMSPAQTTGQKVQKLLSIPHGPYRWAWSSLELYQVTNQEAYAARFDFFCEMYSRFYEKAKLSFPLDPYRPWNLFELDGRKIIVCAFNSCVSNDCFSLVGEIPAEAISASHLEVLSTRTPHSLAIAVWHHDAQGPPMRSDYMDPDTVHLLIDKGFRLGLHGHQHKADAAPHYLFTSEPHTMVVVSAGSLCAAEPDLPRGCSRQYNIIEISDDYLHARVHVREMIVQGVFGPGRLLSLGGRSYAEVQWSPVPSNALLNVGRAGGSTLALIEEAERLTREGEFDAAVAIIDSIDESLSVYHRPLLVDALHKAKNWQRLAELLSSPQNPTELTICIKALVQLKNWSAADKVLEAAKSSGDFSAMTIKTLLEYVEGERKMPK